MPNIKLTSEQLEEAVNAYSEAGGNKAEAARMLNLKRQTYLDRLNIAENTLGIKLGKVADGQVSTRSIEVRKLPKKNKVKRYILTSAQNNTYVHPAFNNLLTYMEWFHAMDRECELIIGSFTYNKSAYGQKSVKRGTGKPADYEEEWYDPEVLPHMSDDSVELAPGLIWCGEQNILPTASNPLRSMEDYNGRASNIVPHAKMEMASVAAMRDETTKFNYTTGCITQRNYIQKRAGIVAERGHTYGAVIVEVDHNGSWWVRQLIVGDDDAIYDMDRRIQAGEVTEENAALAINWGDVHCAEMDLWVAELCWGETNSMIDALSPRYQFMHDLFSMRSRSHHELKNFHETYRKHAEQIDTVEDEVAETVALLDMAKRDFCETVVVPSNHHDHLIKWLNDADHKWDPINAKYYCWLQYHVLAAMDEGDNDFDLLEFALTEQGCDEEVRFLGKEESFVIAKEHDGGIECGLHGHQGPDGSRGTTNNLRKMGRKINKGHDHRATISGSVYSAGACTVNGFNFMSGPTSHSVSHIVTYENGTRAIVTMWDGKYQAECL